jgi:hypothetical protein
MDNIRLAQFLVSIADELDENGFEQEASEVDNIIKGLVVEAQVNQLENPFRYMQEEKYKTSQGEIPMPYPGETYQEWYSRLLPADRYRLHLIHKDKPGQGSWFKTVGGGEAHDVYRQLEEGREFADQTRYPGYKFLGRDINTGGLWYQGKDGKYWYQNPQTQQWKEYNKFW